MYIIEEKSKPFYQLAVLGRGSCKAFLFINNLWRLCANCEIWI